MNRVQHKTEAITPERIKAVQKDEISSDSLNLFTIFSFSDEVFEQKQQQPLN